MPRQITDEQYEAVVAMLLRGTAHRSTAQIVGVSETTVSRIWRSDPRCQSVLPDPEKRRERRKAVFCPRCRVKVYPPCVACAARKYLGLSNGEATPSVEEDSL